MQSRDYYEHDYIYKYFPKIDNQTFMNDMFQKNLLHGFLYSKEEKLIQQEKFQQSNNQTLGVFALSLGIVILHNKIPLLKRVQSKWKKFFTKCFIFFVPSIIVSQYGLFEIQNHNNQMYTKYFEQFKQFKMTGDVLKLNSNITLQV